jgi:succinate-semialdehyde dehydrogenase / glutarate-semialdehyde dehydrogenase
MAVTDTPRSLPPSAVTPELLDRIRRRAAGHDAERDAIEVVSPINGQPMGTVPRATTQDVTEAAARARVAQREWAARSFDERARPLLRFHDLLLDRQAEILDVIQVETGKARKDAYEEVADTALVARYYAFNAERHLGEERRRGAVPVATRASVIHHPVGLTGIIAPWNYPLDMAITDALPALMAGNGVLLKPDRQTPFTALWAVDLLYQAGLPADLFQVLNGAGSVIGTAIIEEVDFLAFTGSTETGRIIARQAGERLMGCSLELGGKNPLIVLDDADLERAARGAARACFANAGQLCIATERVFVHEDVASEFTARFVEQVQALNVGVTLDWDVDVGSIISADQLEHIQGHLEDALDRGATVLTGGRHRPDIGPWVLEPTVLADVPAEARIHAEETFGPVVAIYTFHDDDDAVRRANDSRYGLSASLWSDDEERARRVGRRLQVGTVNINDGYAATWGSVDAPMGGFKDSGLGRRHGREGIVKYTEPQTIASQRGVELGPSPRLPARRFARVSSLALRLLRRIPGLR